MKKIFNYLDYREYLSDFYQAKKDEHSFFSYRLLSQRAGFKSPNFIKLVTTGKRNLSKDSVFKVAKALKLNKGETEYFENLIFFNQSSTLEEKNYYLSKLMKYRKKIEPYKIEESHYRYYSDWFNPVIRELAVSMDFKDNYSELAKAVVPSITETEAEKSVNLLLKMGFIEKRDEGGYVKTQKTITTGPQVKSVAVANYHKEMMNLASESIGRFSSEERDVTSLTVNVSDETSEIIKKRISELRREILSLADSDDNAGRVMQVNFQVFPLSERYNNREGEK